ncbi:MAG: phytoene desaturase [Pseudomonadota bacterium]
MTLHQDVGKTAFDQAIVIGAGLGGLAAAMRLGAKGWRVTVLDRLDMPGGRATSITTQGHRFDLGPTIVTAPEVFRKLFRDCGEDFDDAVDLKPLDPFYTIRWPDGSHLDARANDADMEAEIARLSPEDVAGWRKFLDDANDRYVVGYEGMLTKPMHRLWETLKVLPRFAMLRADQSILKLAQRRVKDERLRMALSFHPLFIGGDPSRVTSMYALVSHLEKEYGVHYAMGGVGAMAQAMANVVERQGGRIRFRSQVDRVLLDGNEEVRGVRLSSGEEVSAKIVVSNADAGHTYDRLLPNLPKQRWTPKKLARTKWSMGLFVWYFGTKGTRDMWPDLGHHTIQSGPRYEGLLTDIFRKGHLANDMSLYIHRPSITDPTAAPDGDDTFYALSPVPHLGHRKAINWSQMAETYRQKVQNVLEETVMPGLGQHLSASMVLTPEDFRDRYLSPHGAGFSIEPRILQSAWFRPHNVSEEVPGLFLVGAGTHPGAGLPGVVASAEVVEQVVPRPGARKVEVAQPPLAPQAAE